MNLIVESRGKLAITSLCHALNLSRATVYRKLTPAKSPVAANLDKISPHPRALKENERQDIFSVLHSERFKDSSPAQVFATLLDEGKYLCSERTMYRLLASVGEVQERRAVTRHGKYQRPELLATGSNQVWSWDITRLKGPEKWNYYYLYVIMDIFSRYAVGWMVAGRENGSYTKTLIEESLQKQNV